jgi:hypothetical protein
MGILPEVSGQDGADIAGHEGGLVAVMVETAGRAGRTVAASVAAGNIVLVVRCAVLGFETVASWIVHEVALAGVDASGVE